MKKVIILSAFALLAIGFKAEAAATTTGNGDPMAVSQSWGLTGYQTPVLLAGKSVVDAGGITLTCPTWYKFGCMDISGTQAYRNDMLNIARTLIATNQVARFPSFSGWVALAR